MYKKKILEKLENTKLTKKEKRIAEFFLERTKSFFNECSRYCKSNRC